MDNQQYSNSQNSRQDRYVKVSRELQSSGVLAAVSPRKGQILQMLADYAVQDIISENCRTAYADHSVWAGWFGVSRTHICELFKELESDGLIARVGKRKRANVYRIADYEQLCEKAYELGKGKPKHARQDNLQPGRSVGTIRQDGDNVLSDCSNMILSDPSNTTANVLSDPSNTEVVVSQKLGSEKGNRAISSQRREKVKDNGNGAEQSQMPLLEFPGKTPEIKTREALSWISDRRDPQLPGWQGDDFNYRAKPWAREIGRGNLDAAAALWPELLPMLDLSRLDPLPADNGALRVDSQSLPGGDPIDAARAAHVEERQAAARLGAAL